jgi:uncharacterized protein
MTANELISLSAIALVSFCMSYLGAAVGLVLGQFRVVLLTYALGSAVVGSSTSLAISTVSAIVGSIGHIRGGRVNLALLVSMGVPSALTAYASARFAASADPRMLKTAIAIAVLITGVHMLFRRRPLGGDPQRISAFPEGKRSFASQFALGAVLGAISGVVGLLLGSLRLPALVRLSGVRPATAVGTNMLIGAITGVSAGFSAMLGGKVDLLAFAVVSPLTLVGAHYGARKTGELDSATLTRWIAYALIPTALVMLAEVVLVT